MTYGAELVIPIEISLLSSRMSCFTWGHNNKCMVNNLDALEEQRGMVALQLINYQ